MDPVTYCIISTYGILMITHSGECGKLSKPTLEIVTEDPNDVHMIGSTAYFNCTDSLNAQRFFWRKEGNKDPIAEQVTPMLTFTNLTKNDNGLYTCQYGRNSELSELSDPVYLYVSDRYPPPAITVEPRSIVQPGQDVTITCASPYPKIVFTLFKGNAQIAENSSNPFIYVIHHANKAHAGQYSCIYEDLQMESDFSEPLMIDVKAIRSPSITWEETEEGKLKIICTAPEENKNMWFQLFNESRDVIDEINVVKQNQVDFIVPYIEKSHRRYYCIYRIRMGRDFADSLISDAAVIGEDTFRTRDHTMGNIIRCLATTMILILLIVILVKYFKYRYSRRYKSLPPVLPASRKKLAVESEYTQVSEMKSDPLEKSSTATLPTTVVSAVIETMSDEEEQQTIVSEEEVSLEAQVTTAC
ncbi:immunoglobulin superfamily member 1-like isoform X1 [Ranitomeya imitator]|uniref:immunoglobulin superfamily member 1-like isoform X1 n=2 Tax=Ranitomeya imitator TaxID=111125 RepID=UPI0037E96E03